MIFGFLDVSMTPKTNIVDVRGTAADPLGPTGPSGTPGPMVSHFTPFLEVFLATCPG